MQSFCSTGVGCAGSRAIANLSGDDRSCAVALMTDTRIWEGLLLAPSHHERVFTMSTSYNDAGTREGASGSGANRPVGRSMKTAAVGKVDLGDLTAAVVSALVQCPPTREWVEVELPWD